MCIYIYIYIHIYTFIHTYTYIVHGSRRASSQRPAKSEPGILNMSYDINIMYT